MHSLVNDFPLLAENQSLVYLDNAATTQKPRAVIEAVQAYYSQMNANPHRGAYDLSMDASLKMEHIRGQIKQWIGGDESGEIIFTKNATEALNLVAMSYGRLHLQEGDELVLSIGEHHSNLVPWQALAKEKKLTLKYLYVNQEGEIPIEEIEAKISSKTKLVAIAHVSNVTGVIHPIEKIIQLSHSIGAVVVVDGTQAVPHFQIDVKALGADFYVFSCHKMLGPMGTGILYGKNIHLNAMEPFLYGGDMIEYVEEQESTYAPIPQKFEAGTQNLASIWGVGAAIDYLEKLGWDKIREIDQTLLAYLLEQLGQVPYVEIVGPKSEANRIGVVAFTVEGVHPHDVSTILNKDGIAIRSGHHCAQPLHRFLKLPATCRVSLYLYNTKADIDLFIKSLKKVRGVMGYGA